MKNLKGIKSVCISEISIETCDFMGNNSSEYELTKLTVVNSLGLFLQPIDPKRKYMTSPLILCANKFS